MPHPIERLQRLTLQGDVAAARDMLAVAKRAGDPLRALVAQATLGAVTWDQALNTLTALPPDALDPPTFAHLAQRLPPRRDLNQPRLLAVTADGTLTAALRLVTSISLYSRRGLEGERCAKVWSTLCRAPLDAVSALSLWGGFEGVSAERLDPAHTPWVARLRSVSVFQYTSSGPGLSLCLDTLLSAWARAPELSLRHLSLSVGALSEETLGAAFAAPWAARLQSLRLQAVDISSRALSLPGWRGLSALRALALHPAQGPFAAADIAALARTPPFAALSACDLPSASVDAAACALLEDPDPPPHLMRRVLLLLSSVARVWRLSISNAHTHGELSADAAARAEMSARLGRALRPHMLTCAEALDAHPSAHALRGLGRALMFVAAAGPIAGPEAPQLTEQLNQTLRRAPHIQGIDREVLAVCALRLLPPQEGATFIAHLLADPRAWSTAWEAAMVAYVQAPTHANTQALLQVALTLLCQPRERTQRRVLSHLPQPLRAALTPWLWRALEDLRAPGPAAASADLAEMPWPPLQASDGLVRALWAWLPPADDAQRAALLRRAVASPIYRPLSLVELLLARPHLLPDAVAAAPRALRLRLLSLLRLRVEAALARTARTARPITPLHHALCALHRAGLLPPDAPGWPARKRERADFHALTTLAARALTAADPDAARALADALASRPDTFSRDLASQLRYTLDPPHRAATDAPDAPDATPDAT